MLIVASRGPSSGQCSLRTVDPAPVLADMGSPHVGILLARSQLLPYRSPLAALSNGPGSDTFPAGTSCHRVLAMTH